MKSERPDSKVNVSSKLFFEFVSKRPMQDGLSRFLKQVCLIDFLDYRNYRNHALIFH